ncbi:MAG TPA: large conductance mechanosensitive channel protein MscL [Candidatus Paceibacterota bacterium]|nr:large conductance mechanosensitive channel protein MscL [Candidatus Paceibacterota bacterium]
MFKEFRKFILRGNVIDLAVGVIIGASFNQVVNSLVTGVITPLIGVAGKLPDFSNWKATVNGSTFLYGDFFNAILSFLIIAATLYFAVITPINKFLARFNKQDEPQPVSQTKECPECLSSIPKAAKRCAFCTAQLSVS